MIYYAELFMTAGQHAPFNAACLQVLRQAYPDQALRAYMCQSHWESLLHNGLDTNMVQFYDRSVVVNKTGSKWQWFKKLINEGLQLMRLLIIVSFQRPKLLCFAFLSPFGQILVSYYAKIFFRQQQILIFLHGMEILKSDKQVKRIDRLYAKLLKSAFRVSHSAKKYVVLEQSAHHYLIEHHYLKAKEMLLLPHPYSFKHVEVSRRTLSRSYPLVMAHIGIARLDKQSHVFFHLAEHFQEFVKAGKLIFRQIGPVLPEVSPYLNSWVQYLPSEEMLSRSAYEQACLGIDYAIFCYPEDAYELTSSGAVLDAITYGKPIMALRNKFFERLFAIPKQPPGKLFNHLPELIAGMEDLVLNHEKQPDYTEAFVDLQQNYSIQNVAKSLKEQLPL